MISAKYIPSRWLFMHRWLQFGNSTMRFCNATSDFDKYHYIRCLHAEFATKHSKAPLSLTTRQKMKPDFCSWQSPIYHAPTYIAVPLLGPHQPWYIESALYYDNIAERSQLWKILFVDNFNMIIAIWCQIEAILNILKVFKLTKFWIPCELCVWSVTGSWV